MSPYRSLVCLALLHLLVDAFALLFEPLWPRVEHDLQLSKWALFGLFAIRHLTSNLSQAVFGCLRDSGSGRWLLWAGPVLGAVGMTLVGQAEQAGQTALLMLCLMAGLTGIGAFHPEAAVFAGTALPEQRTRGLAIFMFGGMVGMGVGPLVSGWLVVRYGESALLWLVPPGVLLIAILFLVGGFRPPEHLAGAAKSVPLRELFARRGGLIGGLLVVGALRVAPNVGMTTAVAFSLDQQGYTADQIGLAQSLFLVSGSAGVFLAATGWLDGWERACLVWCPLLGAPLLLVLGWGQAPWLATYALLALCGFFFNGTTPAMVSYAHQMLPEARGFASALTMGISWGLSGLGVSALSSWLISARYPEGLYYAFVPCLLLSACGAAFFPNAHSATPAVPGPAQAPA